MALKPKDAPDLGRFDWEDAFRLDAQLTEEERASLYKSLTAISDGLERLAAERKEP